MTNLTDDVSTGVLLVVPTVGVLTCLVFYLRDFTFKGIACSHRELRIESELTGLITECVLSSCILI